MTSSRKLKNISVIVSILSPAVSLQWRWCPRPLVAVTLSPALLLQWHYAPPSRCSDTKPRPLVAVTSTSTPSSPWTRVVPRRSRCARTRSATSRWSAMTASVSFPSFTYGYASRASCPHLPSCYALPVREFRTKVAIRKLDFFIVCKRLDCFSSGVYYITVFASGCDLDLTLGVTRGAYVCMIYRICFIRCSYFNKHAIVLEISHNMSFIFQSGEHASRRCLTHPVLALQV